MSIFVHKNSKVNEQRPAGSLGAFHIEQFMAFGNNMAGGMTSGMVIKSVTVDLFSKMFTRHTKERAFMHPRFAFRCRSQKWSILQPKNSGIKL